MGGTEAPFVGGAKIEGVKRGQEVGGAGVYHHFWYLEES